MDMLLCSLARNPDGTLVRPTAYEINSETVVRLLLAAAAVAAAALLLAFVQRNRPGGHRAFVCWMVGVPVLIVHPIWTVSTDSGDCGALQVLASWAVLGIQLAVVAAQIVVMLWRRDSAADRMDYDDRVR